MNDSKPVAHLYTGGADGPFASVDRWPAGVCAAQGWTETPLYTRPPAADPVGDEVERAAHEFSSRNRFEGGTRYECVKLGFIEGVKWANQRPVDLDSIIEPWGYALTYEDHGLPHSDIRRGAYRKWADQAAAIERTFPEKKNVTVTALYTRPTAQEGLRQALERIATECEGTAPPYAEMTAFPKKVHGIARAALSKGGDNEPA